MKLNKTDKHVEYAFKVIHTKLLPVLPLLDMIHQSRARTRNIYETLLKYYYSIDIHGICYHNLIQSLNVLLNHLILGLLEISLSININI